MRWMKTLQWANKMGLTSIRLQHIQFTWTNTEISQKITNIDRRVKIKESGHNSCFNETWCKWNVFAWWNAFFWCKAFPIHRQGCACCTFHSCPINWDSPFSHYRQATVFPTVTSGLHVNLKIFANIESLIQYIMHNTPNGLVINVCYLFLFEKLFM